MLEAITHKYLKKFATKYPTEWKHIFSFSRIIASFLRKGDNLLVNSEIFLTDKWFLGVLIPLFLNQENSIFVISTDKLRCILNNYLPLLQEFGFNFVIKKNEIIFEKHKIFLTNIDNLINNHLKNEFTNQNIIFAEVDTFKTDLNRNLRINLFKKDWFSNSNKSSSYNQLTKTYDQLKKHFFLKAVSDQKQISLDMNEQRILNKIIFKYASKSEKFYKFKKAILSKWAFWVILDHNSFEWSLKAEPIDEIYEIKDLLLSNNLIFLSSFRKDTFFKKYFEKHNIKIKSVISFQSNFLEKNILIYVPSRLMLPNNPLFVKSTIDKCIRFSFLSKGVSIFLLNDSNFKIKLATELASIYGQRVFLENHPKSENQIVCSSYEWWINNFIAINPPAQIIIPLLPIPSMEEPINQQTVEFIRSKSQNWFKDFLQPQSFLKIDKAISPLRRNSGKLVFLDGRINNRKWGREILEMIQPHREISCIFPFD